MGCQAAVWSLVSCAANLHGNGQAKPLIGAGSLTVTCAEAHVKEDELVLAPRPADSLVVEQLPVHKGGSVGADVRAGALGCAVVNCAAVVLACCLSGSGRLCMLLLAELWAILLRLLLCCSAAEIRDRPGGWCTCR